MTRTRSETTQTMTPDTTKTPKTKFYWLQAKFLRFPVKNSSIYGQTNNNQNLLLFLLQCFSCIEVLLLFWTISQFI